MHRLESLWLQTELQTFGSESAVDVASHDHLAATRHGSGVGLSQSAWFLHNSHLSLADTFEASSVLLSFTYKL